MPESALKDAMSRDKAVRERRLGAATSNARLIRMLQKAASAADWQFQNYMSSEEALASMGDYPAGLLVVDVFFDASTGLQLVQSLRSLPNSPLIPALMVAPNCASASDLGSRIDSSLAHLEPLTIMENQLAEKIADLLADSGEGRLDRLAFRYGQFLQLAGEACHDANQPLTSLLCNLELALAQTTDEKTKARIKTSHNDALKIMKSIQRFQSIKRQESANYAVPIYLLPPRGELTPAETDPRP